MVLNPVRLIGLACEICNAFFVVFMTQKGGSLCRTFLAETVETGTKNRCVIEATHVLRRKLRKN